MHKGGIHIYLFLFLVNIKNERVVSYKSQLGSYKTLKNCRYIYHMHHLSTKFVTCRELNGVNLLEERSI